jgi:hypothetical protein
MVGAACPPALGPAAPAGDRRWPDQGKWPDRGTWPDQGKATGSGTVADRVTVSA